MNSSKLGFKACVFAKKYLYSLFIEKKPNFFLGFKPTIANINSYLKTFTTVGLSYVKYTLRLHILEFPR